MGVLPLLPSLTCIGMLGEGPGGGCRRLSEPSTTLLICLPGELAEMKMRMVTSQADDGEPVTVSCQRSQRPSGLVTESLSMMAVVRPVAMLVGPETATNR